MTSTPSIACIGIVGKDVKLLQAHQKAFPR